MMRRLWAVVIFAVLWLAAGSCFSQSNARDDYGGWEFTVTPYLFGAGLDGKAGIAGIVTNVDLPLSDLLDHFEAGFMVAATARKNRWIVGMDAMYFKLSDVGSQSVSGPFGVITIEGTVDLVPGEQMVQPTIGYRLFDGDVPTLDLFVGARYTSLETELTLVTTTSIPSFPGGTRVLEADATWWDPVIGNRVILSITDHLFATALVDCGGFGVGSDLTYQWMVAAGWRFTDLISASLGYRYLKQDYEEDNFLWNMVMKGFVVGAGFEF